MIKVVVIDLDDTLLDTTNLLIPIAKTPAFYKRIQEPLPLMPGALENLKYLQKYELVLLTMGHPESQKTKVRSLGIEKYFKNLYFADPQKNETKLIKFQQIVKDFSLLPNEFISIGNRRSTDIRDAKKVGGQTCLFNYGEHRDELPQMPEDYPDFEVQDHSNLIQTCRL
jgi:putative hydrolase of the HAD superfamily